MGPNILLDFSFLFWKLCYLFRTFRAPTREPPRDECGLKRGCVTERTHRGTWSSVHSMPANQLANLCSTNALAETVIIGSARTRVYC